MEKNEGNLQIHGVTQIFGEGDGAVKALDGFSLKIESGSFVTLIGPSGCGKSTLLRIVSGLDKATAGEVLLDGRKITGPTKDIGMAFQKSNLFPWMTVRQNIAFGLKARGEYKENRDSVTDFINIAGLSGFENALPHQLSGGMAQRASLARSLVGCPKVLLLDEPLGALDAFTRMTMQDEILRLWQKYGMTVLMVTHDVDEAIYLSDKIVVMSPRPARVEEIITVENSRPRARSQDSFLLYRSQILQILNYGGTICEPEFVV